MAVKLNKENPRVKHSRNNFIETLKDKTKVKQRQRKNYKRLHVFITSIKLSTAKHKLLGTSFYLSIVMYAMIFVYLVNLLLEWFGINSYVDFSWFWLLLPLATNIVISIITILIYCFLIGYVKKYREKFERGDYYKEYYNASKFQN